MNQADVQARHKCHYDVPTECAMCRGEGETEDDVFGLVERCFACNGTGEGPLQCSACMDEEEL